MQVAGFRMVSHLGSLVKTSITVENHHFIAG